MTNNTDIKYMLIAIEQAKKGLYRTHPNPMVGAVIVKNNKINMFRWYIYVFLIYNIDNC